VSDEWARTSITVFGPSGEVEQAVDFDGETLDEQLHAAEAWLGGGRGRRPRASPARYDCLLLGVLLTAGMLSLSPTLVRALAGAGGTFWMDVYPYGD